MGGGDKERESTEIQTQEFISTNIQQQTGKPKKQTNFCTCVVGQTEPRNQEALKKSEQPDRLSNEASQPRAAQGRTASLQSSTRRLQKTQAQSFSYYPKNLRRGELLKMPDQAGVTMITKTEAT